MEFNEKLQELRKSRSMTQEELAEALFVSRTAISKWEQGRGYPSLDSLKEISKFFSVTIDDLICSDVKRHTDGGGFGELISVNSPLRSRRIQLDGTLIAA
jgi:transcriptional regulator with XRE-family HTH domain